MKKILYLLLFFPLSLFGQTQIVNVGVSANDGSGDPLRTAFQKVNLNTLAVQDSFGNIYREVQTRDIIHDSIQARIDAALELSDYLDTVYLLREPLDTLGTVGSDVAFYSDGDTLNPYVPYANRLNFGDEFLNQVDAINNLSYYVSNDGLDSDDGHTPETAWETISKVNSSTFKPGSKIFFEKGDVWHETLIIPTSGDADSSIIFTSYGGGVNPIIEPTTTLISWEPIYTNAVSSTVTNVNMRASLIFGRAFVDFNGADLLTDFIGGKLTITDNSGKKIIGYIKAAGTGETYNEQVLNGGFGDDSEWTVGAGWAIGGGVLTGTDADASLVYQFGGEILSLSLLSYDQATTSGYASLRHGSTSPVDLKNGTTTYTKYQTVSGLPGGNSIIISSGPNPNDFTGTIDNVSSKQVLTPSATGVTITSTRDGNIYSWSLIESGFNPNDAAGYTYSIDTASNVYYATLTTAPSEVYVNDTYCQLAHWPTTVGLPLAAFQYPSASSADATHLTDVDLHGTLEANLLGAEVNIYTSAFTMYDRKNPIIISAWDDDTHILTFNDMGQPTITTDMKYYLTAPSGAGVPYSSKSWMLSENTWFYDTDAQLLYVWKTGGGNPGTVEAATGNYGITATSKDYIVIKGIDVRYTKSHGMYFNGGMDYSTIRNCNISYTGDRGITIYETNAAGLVNNTLFNNTISNTFMEGVRIYESSGGLIDRCTFTNLGGIYPMLPGGYPAVYQYNALENTSPNVISDNIVSNGPAGGIVSISWDNTLSGNTVSNVALYCPDNGGTYMDGTGGTMSDNYLFGGTGYGLYIDENASDIIVENNIVFNGAAGCLIHDADDITVRYNYLTGPFTQYGGIVVNQPYTAVTASVYYNVVDCINNYSNGIEVWNLAGSLVNIYNNDVLNSNIGLNVYDRAGIINNVENNLFYNNTTHVKITTGDATGTFDYNLYYGTGDWYWNGSSQATFGDWQTASSGDSHAVNADPLFTSATNLSLQAGSPAINAGFNVVGLTVDILGNPLVGGTRDIGAYEKQ